MCTCRPSIQYQSKCADSPDGGDNTYKEVTSIESDMVYEPMDLYLSSSISEHTKADCSEKPIELACPTGESSSDGVSGNIYTTVQ